MPDCSIDAIKIAKSIQKDELDILRGKEFKFRVKIKKRKRMKKTKKKKNKYTLNQIGETLATLGQTVESIKQDVIELKQDVKSINTRLDYIVSANNLKDLPKNKKI